MIRITRMTDYGIVLLTCFAKNAHRDILNARDLATETHLPPPTVNKILKTLTRKGLLASRRGAKGGYSLARRPEEISVADIINATEGPVAMTECTIEGEGNCSHEPLCPVSSNWHRINEAIQGALESISLAEMTRPRFGCLSGPEVLVTVQGTGAS